MSDVKHTFGTDYDRYEIGDAVWYREKKTPSYITIILPFRLPREIINPTLPPEAHQWKLRRVIGIGGGRTQLKYRKVRSAPSTVHNVVRWLLVAYS